MIVIGVGNRLRRDDAAGPIVADRVRAKAQENVLVCEQSGEGAALMDTWSSGDTVFVIDAADAGGPPGIVHQFDAHAVEIPRAFFRYSTHAFSVAEAIELARVLGRLPAQLYVFAITGQQFEFGDEMTDEVGLAVEQVADRVLAILENGACYAGQGARHA
ncbi:MAG TPA: hydrogenase maturation protease [Candidatus Hydrogenedentes bacterium]|nr:hydrogenase maturation protease [Candidatus Hydrogenedentota bacterium]